MRLYGAGGQEVLKSQVFPDCEVVVRVTEENPLSVREVARTSIGCLETGEIML